jgi:phosphoserine phosphatase
VEGIDVLADSIGKGGQVSVLTQAAMDGDLELEDIYEKRLNTLRPTRGQVDALRQVYKKNTVPHAKEVIGFLQKQGHKVYIISGGLYQPVVEFGHFLGVPRANIRAVGIEYDALSGIWWRQIDDAPNIAEEYLTYNKHPLTISEGKKFIIQELLADSSGRSLLIGDGVSDLNAASEVDLFVGYCGVIIRSKVAENAPIIIKSKSLAPLISIAAGPASLRALADGEESLLVTTATKLIDEGAIRFNNEKFEKKYKSAYSEPYKALHTGPFGS